MKSRVTIKITSNCKYVDGRIPLLVSVNRQIHVLVLSLKTKQQIYEYFTLTLIRADKSVKFFVNTEVTATNHTLRNTSRHPTLQQWQLPITLVTAYNMLRTTSCHQANKYLLSTVTNLHQSRLCNEAQLRQCFSYLWSPSFKLYYCIMRLFL